MKKSQVKLLLDIVMSILWALLMIYSENISLLHEIAGLGALALFLLHKALNFPWIKNVTKKLFTSSVSGEARFKFLLDFALLLVMCVAGLSGIMMSVHIFDIAVNDRALWGAIHASSCWAATVILSVHIGLHWKMIMASFSKMLGLKNKGLFLKTVLPKLLAAAIVVFGVKASFTSNVYTKLTAAFTYVVPDESAGIDTVPNGQTYEPNKKNETITNAETSNVDAAALEEYLGKMYCTGCSKHCPLSSPRCATGRAQAQQATAVFEASASQASKQNELLNKEAQNISALENAVVFTDDEQDSVKKIFTDIIPIMGMYIAGTYYIMKFAKK